MPMSRVVFDFDGVFSTRDSTIEWMLARMREESAGIPRALPWIPWAAGTVAVGDRTAPRARLTKGLLARVTGRSPLAEVERELEDCGRRLARDESFVRGAAVEALGDHLERGDDVIVASAGMAPLLNAWFSERGLDVDVLASILGEDAQGRVRLLNHCFGDTKIDRLAERGWENWDIVYTDSTHDLPLMRRGAHVGLVNPSARMLNRVEGMLPRGTEMNVLHWR